MSSRFLGKESAFAPSRYNVGVDDRIRRNQKRDDVVKYYIPFVVMVILLVAGAISRNGLGQSPSHIQSGGVVARPNQPVEVGLVRWQRDYEKSLVASKESGKPLFVLFQEVPGCAGCQKFGREVLSHPLLVEAIEREFIPVVVFNNRSTGPDAKLRKKFDEPSWNYQVVRFLDGEERDIIPRRDKVWTVPAVAGRMIETLKQQERAIPNYLQTLVAADTSTHEMAAFAMSCFWTGEYKLGKIDGVVATEAGWLDGREVTLVRYDTEQLTLEALATEAAKVRCAQKIYTRGGAKVAGLPSGRLNRSYRTAQASDQKRQLIRFPQLRRIPALNEMQLAKLNAFAPTDLDLALEWLSPNQRKQIGR